MSNETQFLIDSLVIDNKKDERLTNFRLLVSWKAYKDLNLEDRLWYVQKMHVKL